MTRREVRGDSSTRHLLSVEIRQSWKKEQVTHHDVLEYFPTWPDTQDIKAWCSQAQKQIGRSKVMVSRGKLSRCRQRAVSLKQKANPLRGKEVVSFHT